MTIFGLGFHPSKPWIFSLNKNLNHYSNNVTSYTEQSIPNSYSQRLVLETPVPITICELMCSLYENILPWCHISVLQNTRKVTLKKIICMILCIF